MNVNILIKKVSKELKYSQGSFFIFSSYLFLKENNLDINILNQYNKTGIYRNIKFLLYYNENETRQPIIDAISNYIHINNMKIIDFIIQFIKDLGLEREIESDLNNLNSEMKRELLPYLL